MRTRNVKLATLGLMLALGPLAAHADFITVNWQGVYIDGSDSAGTGVFSVGDSITGTFTYDSTAAVDSVSNCTFYITGSGSFSTIGLSGDFDSNKMTVCNDEFTPTKDLLRSFASGSYVGDSFGGLTPISFSVDLNDSAATALSDESLPAPLNPADWDLLSPFHEVQLNFNSGVVRFTVDSFTSTRISVPEPGTLALLCLGLLGMAARHRKTV